MPRGDSAGPFGVSEVFIPSCPPSLCPALPCGSPGEKREGRSTGRGLKACCEPQCSRANHLNHHGLSYPTFPHNKQASILWQGVEWVCASSAQLNRPTNQLNRVFQVGERQRISCSCRGAAAWLEAPAERGTQAATACAPTQAHIPSGFHHQRPRSITRGKGAQAGSMRAMPGCQEGANPRDNCTPLYKAQHSTRHSAMVQHTEQHAAQRHGAAYGAACGAASGTAFSAACITRCGAHHEWHHRVAHHE